MVKLLPTVERASTLFVQERYEEVIPILKDILAQDPYNLDAALRLATAHSSLEAGCAGARRLPQSCVNRSTLSRCQGLPGAALRTRHGLAAGGAHAREDRGGVAGAAAGRRSAGAAEGAARGRGDAAGADRGVDRSVRRGTRGMRRRTATWSSASCTCQNAGCRRHARHWTASRPRTPITRWRSSSAPRSASC